MGHVDSLGQVSPMWIPRDKCGGFAGLRQAHTPKLMGRQDIVLCTYYIYARVCARFSKENRDTQTQPLPSRNIYFNKGDKRGRK